MLYYNPNTPETNCKRIFLIKNPFFNGFLKIIGARIKSNTYQFYSDFVCNNILKTINFLAIHTNS